MHTLSPRRKAYDRTLRTLLYICAGITCALLVFIIGYIFYRGLGNVGWELLSSETSYINDIIGILPNILNTLYIIFLAMIIVLPLGGGGGHLLDGVRLQQEGGGHHRVCHRDPHWHSLHHLRPGGHAVLPPALWVEGRYLVKRPDLGDHDPAHHRPYHPGEFENRAPVLPGGVPGSGRR